MGNQVQVRRGEDALKDRGDPGEDRESATIQGEGQTRTNPEEGPGASREAAAF
jgi:hypothetical protein